LTGDFTSSHDHNVLNIEDGGVFTADGSIDSGGDINVADGGTIYGQGGVSSGGLINVNPANGDTDCTNNCCGANCNTSGDAIEDSALPIVLSSFSVNQKSNNAVISWVTVSEVNFSYFEIYRQVNSQNKELLGIVYSTGNSFGDSYQYIDHNPKLGINYYQIKSVDFDGFIEWFAPAVLIYKPIDLSYDFYPNPALSSQLKTEVFDDFTLEIYSLSGTRILISNIENRDVSALKVLKPGTYIFRSNIGGLIVNQRVTIE